MKLSFDLPVSLLESASLYSALANYRDFVKSKFDVDADIKARVELENAESLIKKLIAGYKDSGWDISLILKSSKEVSPADS